jgi:predicted phage gp36 major capsid-like protein
MASYEEFRFVAAQLAWLERQLQAQPLAVDAGTMQRAMDALVCARAVIDQLVDMGDAVPVHAVSATPASWVIPPHASGQISLQ